MAAVLGVSAYYHDAAAALVVDGQLVAAVQEERYSRRKNDPSLPVSAMRACLRVGGLDARDLAEVVYYESPYAKLERVLVSTLESFPRSMRQFGRAMASQLGHKLWVLDALSDALGVDRDLVTHRTHHASHAASAYYPSGFEDAAVLTMDGVGEDVCTALWRGQGRTLTPLAAQHYPHSLGLLYAALTAYLGFRVNEGEYKVMGLAALGQPRLRDAFAELVQLASDGSLRLDLRYFAHHHDVALGFGPALERLLGPRRPPGRRWDLSTTEDQHYADVAATLQAVTEELVVHLVRQAMTLAGSTRVCLAGGVALNAVANARVLAEAGVTDLFVQPAAGDAGGAVGAALLGALERGEPRTGRLYSAALGEPASASEAHTLARAAGLTARVVDDAPAAAAELLARGAVVAWVDGRLELGPRALGHRSLLALPAPMAVRDRLNHVIKQREAFRPFAPAAPEADAPRWFDGVHPGTMAFMTSVARVRAEARPALEAVTHADGTARLQTVNAAHEPTFHALLRAVERHTGLPVVLNTSLNGRDMPIVGGSSDALAFLLSHPVAALVVGDVLITKGGEP